MKTLKDAKIGETVKVVKLHGRGSLSSAASWTWASRRASKCASAKVAPLGDPMEVTVRGYELSLRKADADMIEVQ